MRQTLALIFALTACGNDGYNDPGDHEPGELDPVIGATCFDDRDCLSECARGDDFPGGFCTLSCRSDLDCTSDTLCADTHDGVCLFPCDSSAECGFLGPAYFCREKRDFRNFRIVVCMSD